MKALLMAVSLSLPLFVQQSPDDLNVVADPGADFSKFRTFTFRVGKIDSPRPEIDNPLFAKRMTRTIVAALAAKGLRETPARPDLIVDFSISSGDINTSQRGGGRGIGPQPLRYTVGLLTIDLSRPGDQTPVWRGVYRDGEMTGSKLMQKLPEDARKLIAKYKGPSN
jgi:hypothetical protein